MSLYLVRHAKAGERASWTGPDEARPLSKKGRRQSDALAARLSPLATGVLVSSPYVRCVQTLEPLAALLGGAEVQIDDRLAEENPASAAIELLDELEDGSVLCSHGDVIPATIDALVRRGLELRSDPDWRKASVWAIDRSRSGRYSRARAWPPPVL